ncbi:unnamed protein product [Ilex paraguariensis]|uniref:Calcineurin-like phosphoesterase domain-containing protein n=1 Tax=Ilex paraguariensis TaxID=185542 RepID=A0ABC8TMS4_9AQUA
MEIVCLILLFLFCTLPSSSNSSLQPNNTSCGNREIIDVKSEPEDVVWVVQLSDLHFSVHHPDRALDFKELMGPALSMINPSLVLITGDLTVAEE